CRPGEKARVQGIIESRMGRRGVVGMEECECVEDRSARMDRLFSWAFLYGITVHGLVETVAQEKAASIERQRPAIRSLGRERLKALIHEVFERLEDPSKPAHETATRFGLSPASFSRFAGSRWREEPPSEKEGRVPDLWLNVARVLSNHPGFVEAAKVSGVWPQVERVL
ncbi:MAG: hypothetical protein NTW86_15590, partial [Candidatus Sumerlaeota bacterium]|nr:hypothetical protein [Candidatus Sumerlaeota bacterium]